MGLLDINDTINNDESLIRQFIEDNYDIYGTYTIENGLFNGSKTVIIDIDGNVYVKNKNIKSLTNGLFRWGEVRGYFDCGSCNSLESLEGAPGKCKGFNCSYCNNLKSLEGAPKKCEAFICSGCKNLISIKGALRKCINFWCTGCDKLPNKSELKRLYPQYEDIYR